MVVLGLWGGGGADELLSFRRARDDTWAKGGGGGVEWRSWQVLRERYVGVGVLSLLHRRLEKRERVRIGEISPLVAEAMGESGMGQLCVEKWTELHPEGML